MLKGATIVFDLDGTLVDTAPDLTNALSHVLRQRGHTPAAPALVRESAGRGARAMIEEALSAAGAQDDVDAMLADFLVHYEANIAAMSRPFPGAVAALERLTSAGARLAICTNKRERLARMLLQAIDMEHYFSGMAGRDTFSVSKPDPGHLLSAIAAAGGDTGRAVMIGDSAVDLRAAHGANVPSILVTFGYCPPPPEGPRPDAVIDHFDALEGAVLPLLKRLTDKASAPF
ncbi:MAG TPA: HAD-IA family hydrolase [Methyloceanibacter sp.]|nr:HAD-IA family hydrolase [Methyloceanibacter sp.]